jgi:hypothetical protein
MQRVNSPHVCYRNGGLSSSPHVRQLIRSSSDNGVFFRLSVQSGRNAVETRQGRRLLPVFPHESGGDPSSRCGRQPTGVLNIALGSSIAVECILIGEYFY